ncbi:MAG: FAD-binding protein [Armatimonadetes bacterium]|nr:FAD-binding protein [Armatimonadota bacterium]
MARCGVVSLELEMKERFPDLDTSKWQMPSSVEELASLVGKSGVLRVGGHDEYRMRPPKDQPSDSLLLLDNLKQLLWLSAENQLVSVQSGMYLSDLNKLLHDSGFEIPVGLREENQAECIGDLIAMNLPHWNMGAAGSWRDWIVKMKIVLASGEVVVSGADVVKNVTGFDVHKLVIGARHTLGVIAEVTLRIRPKTLPREWPPIQLNHGELFQTTPEGLRLVRAHLKDQLEPAEGEYQMEHYVDEAGCLLLAESLHNKDKEYFDVAKHGFVWRSHVGEYALAEFSETEQKLMKRAKEIFDPTNKLNPGEFGFI